MIKTKKRKCTVLFAILLISVSFITVFSKCSPLYGFNNSPDVTVIFEVGRRMFDGQLLYRDVIDQKGPFLFVIYGIASLISDSSYIGLYFTEILFSFITLCFVYKTVSLKYDSKKSLLSTFFVACLMYCCPLNTYGGDTAELMMMPFFVYLYYIGFRYVYKNVSIKPYEYLIVGITSGCVLWSKYTLLGIYIAWFIIPAVDMIKEKNFKKLFSTCLIIAGGVLISTIPWIIYFGINNYFADFINFYFIEQGKYYKKLALSTGILFGIYRCFIYLAVPIISFVSSLLIKKSKHQKIPKKLFLYNLLLFIVLFIFIYIIGNGGKISYYFIQMFIFAIPGAMALIYTFDNLFNKFDKSSIKKLNILTVISVIAIGLIISFTTSSTIHYLGEDEEETPYYQFSQYIKDSGVENPKITGNCIDVAPFYKYMDCFENYKYVSPLNAAFPEMTEHYISGIKNGDYDFIINYASEGNYDKTMYKSVKTVTYEYQGKKINFYLYQKIT